MMRLVRRQLLLTELCHFHPAGSSRGEAGSQPGRGTGAGRRPVRSGQGPGAVPQSTIRVAM